MSEIFVRQRLSGWVSSGHSVKVRIAPKAGCVYAVKKSTYLIPYLNACRKPTSSKAIRCENPQPEQA
jgi:hypothetical protein